MDFDVYGETINGEKTYKSIADMLKLGKSVLIGWTDELYSYHDILFSIDVIKVGYIQRGIQGTNLFVSIISCTSYAFNIDSEKEGTYIQRKLGMMNETGDKLKELINGIIRCLNESEV